VKNLLARILITTAVCVVLSLSVSAQEPPAEAIDDVARITTSLIQLDVSVVDRHGKMVSDLRPDEIEILENGKNRTLTNFSFVSYYKKQNARDGAAGASENAVTSAPRRRTFVLVVDDLAMSFESMKHVRIALTRFIDEQMLPGDIATIVRIGGGPQRLTTDRNALRRVIDDLRWNSRGHEVGRSDNSAASREDDQQIGEELATASLTSLNKIVKALGPVQGRKSVIFFSDGFALLKASRTGFSESGSVADSIRRIADSAHRASVVVHAVEARGLDALNLTAVDPLKGLQRGAFDLARRQTILDQQDGLRHLAEETGGLSILNTNDINSGVGRILEQQGYYLVGYEPDDETFDPSVSRFNRIEVRIKRPGCMARYRSGFYNQAN
jgi:VWFA-related protein